MSNYVYIATSLDGYIAEKDGGLDWLNTTPNPDGSDFGFAEFLDSVDAIVMGRNTYEAVLSFGVWPYPKKVFVLTSTLKDVPERMAGKVEYVNGPIDRLVDTLYEKGYRNLYIDGGRTIQSFLESNLIDELIITQIPIILGDGIPLFGKLNSTIMFEYVNSEVYNESLVKVHYRKVDKA